ncbi:MAG TPA: tetratricopeptide repeat protein [Longimicrobium sp.]|jgi:tetratricopeptide (TPR) repeat protein|nr:tetratricopeptide repeat protein [Longimicrobium sp.]
MSPEPLARPSGEDGTAPAFPRGTALPPEMLAELPSDMAFAVWQVLRSVTLWTGEPEQRRASMFDPAYMKAWEHRLLTAPLEPEARFPLAVIVGELAGPDQGAGRLSWACVCVADWALGRGATRAALSFAEAAARAAPEHPRYAWLVGRLMRSHGDPRGGERWLRRALKLAVAQRDWETQARALTGLGNLCVETGRYPEARGLHTRSLRVSRRWHLREQEGMALHDLFVIATEEGNRAEAEVHARGALDAYDGSTPRVCTLAHDVAYSWMAQGYFDRALPVFQALRPRFGRPDDELRVVGNIARAAGGSGNEALFGRMRMDADALLGRLVTRETLAPALLEIALGAAALGQHAAALDSARAAITAAQARNETNVRMRAESLIQALSGAYPAAGAAGERRTSYAAASGERLAEDLVEAIRHEAAAAHARSGRRWRDDAGEDGVYAGFEDAPPEPALG